MGHANPFKGIPTDRHLISQQKADGPGDKKSIQYIPGTEINQTKQTKTNMKKPNNLQTTLPVKNMTFGKAVLRDKWNKVSHMKVKDEGTHLY